MYHITGNPFQRCRFHDDGHAALVLHGRQFSPRLTSMPSPAIAAMLQSINRSATGVHQKTLNRLVRFIDEFKQMNFVNDTEMEQRLEAVRKELLSKTAEEYSDSASARAKLVNGLSKLRDQAGQRARENATELVQRFGQMGRRKFNLAA